MATDLLLAKEAVIEGNILASSVSYKAQEESPDKNEQPIKGSMIIGAGTFILPILRPGEVREIRLFPRFQLTRSVQAPTIIKLADEVSGGIIFRKKEQSIYWPRTARELQFGTEGRYYTFVGEGEDNYNSWFVGVQDLYTEGEYEI